jgi:hypothetical protein
MAKLNAARKMGSAMRALRLWLSRLKLGFGLLASALCGAYITLVLTFLPGAIDGGSDYYFAFGALLGVLAYFYWLGTRRQPVPPA